MPAIDVNLEGHIVVVRLCAGLRKGLASRRGGPRVPGFTCNGII